MPDFLTALGLGPSAPNGVDFSTLGYGGLVADARRAIKSDEPATLRRQSLMEKLAETWPARLASSVYGAVTLPGDVYAGRTDPNSDEGIGRAADLAGLVMGGTYGAAPAGAVGSSGGRIGRLGGSAAPEIIPPTRAVTAPSTELDWSIPLRGLYHPAQLGAMSQQEIESAGRKVLETRLGPMLRPLMELGYTPQQVIHMTPVDAYRAIKGKIISAPGSLSPDTPK